MNRNSIKFLQILVSLFLMNIMYTLYGFGQTAYEGYYLRSANYPSFGNLWTPAPFGDGESQGVTNDNDNWYFTWTTGNNGYLFKIPVEVPLDNNVLQNPRVTIANMTQFPDLNRYWHWGDPDHYKYSGIDYIIVPITGGGTPIIAIFRANNLSLVAYGQLNQQQSTGWCSIHPKTGNLYTSEDFDYASGPNPCSNNCDNQDFHCLYPRLLLLYKIPWNLLQTSGGKIDLEYMGSEELLDEGGGQMELYNMQGGEFTDSGELLYISTGSGCCSGRGAGQQYALDGIYVFNTQNWRAIKRSYNHDEDFPHKNLPKYFDYYYILGCDGAASWSPEGLTIWDLDDGRAPNISGQLHVLLFKYRVSGDNREVFEHFGSRLYVDPVNGVDRPLPTSLGDSPLPGGPNVPFKTFNFAYSNYPAWGGSEIVLKAGSYSAVGTYSTRIRLVSKGGAAILGK